MPSCAHWLNVKCGLDLVTAREKVRVAHALAELPAEQGAMLRLALEWTMEWVYRESAESVPETPEVREGAAQPQSRRRRRDEHAFKDVPYPARQADALAALAERFLGAAPGADESMSTADPTTGCCTRAATSW